jgi:hypothetical protein
MLGPLAAPARVTWTPHLRLWTLRGGGANFSLATRTPMDRRRAWVRYVEEKYGTALRRAAGQFPLADLLATQSEIEQVKYDLVRHEGFRINEPILAFKARGGGYYVIDGHTRVRVLADLGRKTIAANLYTSPDAEVDAEVQRMALAAGGGAPCRVADMPVIDRLGRDTEAWARRREELLAKWRRESAAGDGA